ncbi:hypothetical protein [Pseudarthrobacter sp. WHRI 8279]|uniref:hypothetical protein n=1 Tax=Pseudarthrobacter sp. WHRI 8279 TaxID=3162566 RepID=UPI0032EC7386
MTMSSAQDRGKRQLLLTVLAVSAASIAIGWGRQKSSSAALAPTSTQNPATPAVSSKPSRAKKTAFIVLSVVAVLVLAMDAYWLYKVGDIASNALGATFVGIGGMLLLFADTDAMGLSKRDWRRWTKPAGNIFVALGARRLPGRLGRHS